MSFKTALIVMTVLQIGNASQGLQSEPTTYGNTNCNASSSDPTEYTPTIRFIWGNYQPYWKKLHPEYTYPQGEWSLPTGSRAHLWYAIVKYFPHELECSPEPSFDSPGPILRRFNGCRPQGHECSKNSPDQKQAEEFVKAFFDLQNALHSDDKTMITDATSKLESYIDKKSIKTVRHLLKYKQKKD